MDPWLEATWRDVHSRLIIGIANHLQHQLPASLVARAEETVLVDLQDERPSLVRPDVGVIEPRTGGSGIATMEPPVAVAKPFIVHVPEPEIDRHIEIIDVSSGGRVVTAVEVLSPSNKLPGRGRDAYESKQRDFIAAGVNLVEIDLVRKGRWAFSVDEDAWGAHERPPYMVCVFQATRPGLRAIYPLPLREPLPRIAIPLRATDREVALDLQAVLSQAYEDGRYELIDYGRPLYPPLPAEDAAWTAELLRKAGKLG
jgi:hypothetical protein